LSEHIPESSLEDISKVLADLMKTIKVVSLYPENNPIPAKLKESFVERFTELISDCQGLRFVISRDGIQYNGETVYVDRSAEDNLASLLHDSGITEICFSSAFGFDEANLFFKTVKSFVNREPGAEDLVAVLWQANIEGFEYKTLEDMMLREYDGEFVVHESDRDDDSFIRHQPDDDPDGNRVQYSAIFLEDEPQGVPGDSPGEAGSGAAFSDGFPTGFTYSDKLTEEKMGLTPVQSAPAATLPDTTIILNEAYTIEESDLKKVQEIIGKDNKYDVHQGCINLLAEMLSQEREYREFTETIAVVEKIQTEFIRSGKLDAAGEILAMLRQLQQDVPKERANLRERIQNALVMAGGWEKLSYLSDALNANSSISAQSIDEYLSHFGWEALSTIVDLLGTLEYRQHREAICDYLVRVGQDRVNIIAKGIYDRRWFVVRNMASVLARIGGDEAIPHLEKAMAHEDARVRFQIARGLTNYQSERNIGLLMKLLWDSDERVRDTAFQSLLELSGEAGLRAIVATINDDRFASLSDSQQEKLIMLLSELGGEHAVSYLVSLISSGGLFGSQVKDFYQRVAFQALAHNRSEKAKKALLRLAKSWKGKLRRMAKDALRQRREIMYSGE
jgi:hypothetical protein